MLMVLKIHLKHKSTQKTDVRGRKTARTGQTRSKSAEIKHE